MGNQCSPRSAGCAARFVNKFVSENRQRKIGSPWGGYCHVSSARWSFATEQEKALRLVSI